MKRSVLDTDTLSYLFRETDPAVVATARQYIRVFRYLTISAITLAEVIEGFESVGNYSGAEEFLRRAEDFEILAVGAEEAVLAGRILAALRRTGRSIGDLDPFIAAVAITNGRILVTNNVGHYQRIVDLGFPLELENWLPS